MKSATTCRSRLIGTSQSIDPTPAFMQMIGPQTFGNHHTQSQAGKCLGMPHSPRLHRGQLYVLSSNNGFLVRVDSQTGHQEAMTFFPGFARGMVIQDNHAIVAVSLPRWGKSFEGSAVAAAMKQRGLELEPWRGLQIVDLATSEVVEGVRFDGDITELFDVCILPGVRCAQAITGAALQTAGLVREEL